MSVVNGGDEGEAKDDTIAMASNDEGYDGVKARQRHGVGFGGK